MRSTKFILPVLAFILIYHLRFGFYSIDEASYYYLTRMMVERGSFAFDTGFGLLGSPLSRSFFGVVSGDNVYSVFPPGFSFLSIPFYMVFGLKGMQIANIFFTLILAWAYTRFLKGWYGEKSAVFGSVVLILATQILNYSVSMWSHISAALLIIMAYHLLLNDEPGFSGLLLGLAVVVRYSSVVLLMPFLAFQFLKDKKRIPIQLTAFIVGTIPLLVYNQSNFGSPLISGMTILNAEKGYHVFNPEFFPKALITNLLHYTFYPELEYLKEKASLIETTPFIAFAVLGAYLLWKERKERRGEISALGGGVIIYVLFLSGTWSLGGLAHNMRLLTDIIPLIMFFSLAPLAYLDVDLKQLAVGGFSILILMEYWSPSFESLKSLNFTVATIILLVSLTLVIMNKPLKDEPWKKIMYLVIILSLGLSLYTASKTTRTESLTRQGVREAAQAFEKAVPEESVVFVHFGDYPMYTEKEYLFLDYSQGEKEIDKAIKLLNGREMVVLFKTEQNKEVFKGYALEPTSPVRAYRIRKSK